MVQVTFVAFLATLLAVLSSTVADDCTVTSYDQVAAAVAACTKVVINGITVPAGKALEIKLKDGATLTFQGTIKFEHSNWAGPLVVISGKNVNVNGDGATLDGQGALYWDGKGGSGTTKPKFFRIKTSGSKFSHIKLLNCPIQCVSINSASDTVLNEFTIDVSAGDSGSLGHNTDGFDVSSSTGITVENSVIKNQDDCVAVNQGSNMLFHNLTCSGGHGISLSVGQSSENGSPNTVKNITFSSCNVLNSDNGIHVKTHTDAGTGSVSDVTYKDIKLSGINKYGINVQQDYKGGSSTGSPSSNIPITNLVLHSVTGTMSGGSNSMPVYILCGSSGCSSWPWDGVSITNGKKADSCNFAPTGFSC